MPIQLAGLVLAAQSVCAASPEQVALSVGHGWALVHETHSVKLKRGEQELRFEHVPPAADLSSMVLRARRLKLEMGTWGRLGPHDTQPNATAGLSAGRDGRDARWSPKVGLSVRTVEAEPGPGVWCTLISPVAGRRQVTLTYLVPGFDWQAYYQVTVRGELTDESAPLAVDLVGKVSLTNPLNRSFTSARVHLLGGVSEAPSEPTGPKGILMLEDNNPLWDLWREPSPEPHPDFIYAIPKPVRLAPAGTTDVPLTTSRRVPAERLYIVTAEAMPLGALPLRPVRRQLVFHHVADTLSGALPPGPVRVFLGRDQARLQEAGFLPRTPPSGEIRIDLGRADQVLAARRSLGRSEPVAGYYEEAIEIVIENRGESAVLAEIDEKPPVHLAWKIVQSNEKYVQEAHRLKFKPTIEPGTEGRFYYRLRVRQPRL